MFDENGNRTEVFDETGKLIDKYLKKIQEEFTGGNYRQIAKKYGLSARQVIMILDRNRKKAKNV